MANDYAKNNINVELAKVAKTIDMGQVCPHNRRERLPKALDQLLGPHKAQRNVGFT